MIKKPHQNSLNGADANEILSDLDKEEVTLKNLKSSLMQELERIQVCFWVFWFFGLGFLDLFH